MAAKTAIKATRFDGFRLEPEQVVIIGLDTDDGPEHPRYDERVKLPLREETVQNFMAIGVHKPIVVCVMPDGTIEVDDGRRRIMHAREANRRLVAMGEKPIKVPAVVARGDDDHHAMLGIVLNEHAEQDALLTKIAKAKRLYDRCGDLSEVALAFAVTPNAVRKWLKIDELPAFVKKEVSRGVLSAHAACAMHDLSRDEQRERIAELKTHKESTGKRATAAQAKHGAKGGKGPRRSSAKVIREIQDALEGDAERQGSFNEGVALGIALSLDARAASMFLSTCKVNS